MPWICGLCAYRGTQVELDTITDVKEHLHVHVRLYIHHDKAEQYTAELKSFSKMLRFVSASTEDA